MSQPSRRAEYLHAEFQGKMVSVYVLVLIWDVLNNLRNDYMLLFKQRFHVTSGAYVVCRLASLVYLLGFTIFFNPIQACNTAFVAFSSFYPVVISASTFLFLFRVRAVYGGDRLVTATFGFLWLAVVGTSMTVPFSGNAIGLGDPYECVIVNVGTYPSVAGITLTAYDTLVFFTISYRLDIFSGVNLSAFSKTLFTDGQMYYMITAATNCVAILLVYIPNTVPGANSVYHGVMVLPSMTLMSIMACRVYRNTKLRRWPSMPLSVVQLSTQRYAVDSEGDASDSTGSKSGTDFSAGMHHDLQGAVR
ncbi:hypothetical protein DFH09DRAFT_1325431 [Mycena vulgaris]|nr:hypothetical protein DFH09DRAFT_1325431 [Mycena vulgaris]